MLDKNSLEQKQRKERRDKGTVYITERDLTVLTWIGEQYGVRLDQLRKLLGREAQKETITEGEVAESTTRRIFNRWIQAGLVDARKFLHREPVWVWLTRRGLNQLDLPYSYWEPNVVTLKHIYWVNQVRLYYENSRGGQIIWHSERGLKQQSQEKKYKRLVDAEMEFEGDQVALEVEITPKKLERLRKIARDLSNEYDGIVYFTNSTTIELVQKVVKELPESKQKIFRIRDLEDTIK